MKNQTSSEKMMACTNKLVRYPSVSEQRFLQVMHEQVMPAIPAVDTGAIFLTAQELVKDETDNLLNTETYLWTIYWHGFRRPALVQKESERIFELVREKVTSVGIRTGMHVATPLKERWVLRNGQWTVCALS